MVVQTRILGQVKALPKSIKGAANEAVAAAVLMERIKVSSISNIYMIYIHIYIRVQVFINTQVYEKPSIIVIICV